MNKPFDHSDDPSTWHRMKRGDEAAFEWIYRAHVQTLFRYGFSLRPDEELVMDLIHDLFSELWARRTRLGETDSIKFYLLRSLKNRLMRHAQRSRRMVEASAELPGTHPVWEGDPSAEDDQETLRSMTRHVSQLSPRQQEIIRLRFYEGLSHREIAELMGMNPQSAKNLLHRTIEALRTLFSEGNAVALLGLLAWL